MPTLKELIKLKNRRLEQVPDEFLTQVEKSQKRIFGELLGLLDQFTLVGGKIEISSTNLGIVDKIIEDLKVVLYDSDYADAVASFAKEFDKQGAINENYFKEAFEDFKTPEITEVIIAKTKREAVESLLGASLDENFLKPANQLLSDLVTSGAGFKEAVQSIREFAEGGEEVDGKLLQYSKQIAHDQFAFSDRAYTNAAAEEIDAEWYFYSGGEIPTTRCFCEQRNGKHFYYKEIESWGRGENLGECRSGDLWQGANRNTNEQTIFIFLGGWNCMHSIQPVSIFDVPKDVVQNAIDKWGYEPSEFEVEEIGL